MNNKIVIGIIAILVILGAGFIGYSLHTSKAIGASNPDVTQYTGLDKVYVSSTLDQNGLYSIITSGNLTTGTSTDVLSVLNPFAATSTVDYLIYSQTGLATSSYILSCGTSTTAYAGSITFATLIDSVTVATSTYYSRIINGMGSAGGEVNAGSNSKARISVKPGEYIVCALSTVWQTTAFTDTTSTFGGTYTIRWLK